jgi:hypothetical protein
MSSSSEKPILFSGAMVRAILAGQKTQTRRVVKPQPELARGTSGYATGTYLVNGYSVTAGNESDAISRCQHHWPQAFKCPYVKDNRLWVRETCAIADPNAPIYRADLSDKDAALWRWKPNIFMPRWASRITLEIINVRLERLQKITPSDALAEGSYLATDSDDEGGFVNLWDSINSKRAAWELNPFIWVIEFNPVVET